VWRLAAGLLLGLAVTAFPSAALAHTGGEPFIHVPVDHVVPGESFPVVAADLGPDATVTIELVTDAGVVPIGTVVAGPDGHFETTLVMPATAPQGYRQISATSDDGSVATVWVQIGTGAGSGPPSATGLAIDPSLALLLGGAAVVLAIGLVRSRRKAAAGPPGSGTVKRPSR
jgi:hypothetical protein